MATVKTTFPFPEVYEGGSGEPLVLLHGFTETWRVWLPILKLLEPHYHVIAPTLPGHIGGLKLNEPASPEAIFNALAAQLRERGISNAHFVGQSLGGWAVYEMARRGFARSALGLSPAGGFRDRQVVIDFMRRSLKLVKLFPIVSPIIQFLSRSSWLRQKLFTSEMMHADRMPYEVVKDRFTRIGQMTIFKEFLSADLQSLQPMPAGFNVPLRVVWCEKDTTLRFEDCGQPLLDVLGLKTHGVLKDCGHNPMYDDPEGVMKAIMDFTREVDAGKVHS